MELSRLDQIFMNEVVESGEMVASLGSIQHRVSDE